jgi:2-alkyl-3-oxoalkanoate reductase
MSLRGKKVFVTGGTGFLGEALVRRLSQQGARTRVLIRHTSDTTYLDGVSLVEVVIGDLTDRSSVFKAMEGCDYVFHVAASLGGTRDEMERVNVEGTRHVTDAAASIGIERLLHVSSIAYYGYGVDGPVTEDTPPTITHDGYAITKRKAEERVRLVAEKRWMSYSIIRPGMIYGPQSQPWTAQMFKIARRNPTLFIGDGSGHAHPIHVDDVVDMCLMLATHTRAEGQAFNCTPDPAPTWREFLGAYSKLAGHNNWLGVPAVLAHLGATLQTTFSHRAADKAWQEKLVWGRWPVTYKMDKAREQLGWQPSVPLQAGIEGTAPWLREQGLLQP